PLVRRAGQGPRRRHRGPPRGGRVPLDGRRAEPPLDHPGRFRPGGIGGGRLGRHRRLAVQGPMSRSVLLACAEPAEALAGLRYFQVTPARIAGIPVEVSRTGYTGELGYEVWVEAGRAEPLWDAVMEARRPYGLAATVLLALDVARIEAGLILLDVDYVSARNAVIPSQRYSPYEIGLGRLVRLDKAPFVGQEALRLEALQG